MVRCPVGTYNPVKSGTSVAACLPCPAGSYCLEGVSAVSGVCDYGYYCPSPFTNPYGSNPATIGSYGPHMVGSVGLQDVSANCASYAKHG